MNKITIVEAKKVLAMCLLAHLITISVNKHILDTHGFSKASSEYLGMLVILARNKQELMQSLSIEDIESIIDEAIDEGLLDELINSV